MYCNFSTHQHVAEDYGDQNQKDDPHDVVNGGKWNWCEFRSWDSKVENVVEIKLSSNHGDCLHKGASNVCKR